MWLSFTVLCKYKCEVMISYGLVVDNFCLCYSLSSGSINPAVNNFDSPARTHGKLKEVHGLILYCFFGGIRRHRPRRITLLKIHATVVVCDLWTSPCMRCEPFSHIFLCYLFSHEGAFNCFRQHNNYDRKTYKPLTITQTTTNIHIKIKRHSLHLWYILYNSSARNQRDIYN